MIFVTGVILWKLLIEILENNMTYSTEFISSGLDIGKYATRFNHVIVRISDTRQEATDYTHKHAAMRMQAFNVEMSNLLAIAEGNV